MKLKQKQKLLNQIPERWRAGTGPRLFLYREEKAKRLQKSACMLMFDRYSRVGIKRSALAKTVEGVRYLELYQFDDRVYTSKFDGKELWYARHFPALGLAATRHRVEPYAAICLYARKLKCDSCEQISQSIEILSSEDILTVVCESCAGRDFPLQGRRYSITATKAKRDKDFLTRYSDYSRMFPLLKDEDPTD